VILRALRIAGQVRKAWAQVERPDLARLAADGHVVIVFSDIEGSTEQNQALGDRGWVKVLERHDKLIYKLVDDYGGHVVKSQGDGFMIAFGHPAQAVLCSIEVQRALHGSADRWGAIRVRFGIHMGTSVSAETTSSGSTLRWRRE
jgi:adenylate cyclase